MSIVSIHKLGLSTFVDSDTDLQFKEAMGEVLKNIQDERTFDAAPRTITISITIYPKNDRTESDMFVNVRTKLAPVKTNYVRLDLTTQQEMAAMNHAPLYSIDDARKAKVKKA